MSTSSIVRRVRQKPQHQHLCWRAGALVQACRVVLGCVAVIWTTAVFAQVDSVDTIADLPAPELADTSSTDVAGPGAAQASGLDRFLTPSDTFSKSRFWKSVGLSAGLYTAASVGLYQAWYRNYELGPFKLINDRQEWEHMDKLGHGYTAYHYARWSHQGLQWSGTRRGTRLALAWGTSMLLQSTVEVMDGYSQAWGFSWTDMAYNACGATLFVGQELLFREQRILPKFSAFRQNHSRQPVPSLPTDAAPASLHDRAVELYGDTPWERFVKDYNGQTVWLSTNPAVLAGFGESTPASWLMLSVGYSPRNIYGALYNNWGFDNTTYFGELDAQREREWVLSLDIDFKRIPAKRPVVKTLLHLLNHMKFPAPALVLNAAQKPDWRWLYY